MIYLYSVKKMMHKLVWIKRGGRRRRRRERGIGGREGEREGREGGGVWREGERDRPFNHSNKNVKYKENFI